MTRVPVATEVPLSRSSGSQAPSSFAILSDTKPNRPRRPESGSFGRREVLVELPGEPRNLAPDDLVVMSFPGLLDQRRAVVGKQEGAAGHGVRRREIVAEGEADEGGRKIVARDQRLQAGAPARRHVARRGAEPSVRRPEAGRRRLAALERVRQRRPDGRRAERAARHPGNGEDAARRRDRPIPAVRQFVRRGRGVRRPRSRRRKPLGSRRPPRRR